MQGLFQGHYRMAIVSGDRKAMWGQQHGPGLSYIPPCRGSLTSRHYPAPRDREP